MPIPWRGARRDLERQLGQAARAAAAALAGRAPARRRLPAGDEARRRRVRRAARRGARRARLRGRGARRGDLERRGDPLAVGLEDVVAGLEGAPGFPHPEARAVSATCGGVRVVSVYVPNGREPDSDHYRYKLAWLAALREMVAAGPDATIVCGDMNIAPTDEDVFDPDAYVGQTHVTPPERAALAELQALGLRDVVRDRWPGRARVHLLGLPGRHVPPGPRDADRPRARGRPGGRARARRPGSTARRARAGGRATTRR